MARSGEDSTTTGTESATSDKAGAFASVMSMSHASYSAGVSCRRVKCAKSPDAKRFRSLFRIDVIAPSAFTDTEINPFESVMMPSVALAVTGA